MTRNEQYDLALEIVKLQDKIKESKKHNKHARLKCNLKKIGALSKIGIAFSAIPLAGTLITSAAGWNPFKLNEEEVPSIITTTIDKEGNETEEKKYAVGSDDIELYYYTAWQKTDNNNFERHAYTYDLTITEEELRNIMILINSEKNLSLERIEELFEGKVEQRRRMNHNYSESNVEYTPKITEQDLNREGYVESKIIKIDESDKITRIESKSAHYGAATALIFIEVLFMGCEAYFLALVTNFFKKRKEELQESPYYLNTKELEQQLKAKQLLFETIPYQALLQLEQATEPQKVLKKEPERMQQGQ
jgi:hypothetical protein